MKGYNFHIWVASSKFVSSSIRSWQILTAHAQPFRGARDLAFCLMVPLDSLLVWSSSGGSGETARMRRLAWTFAARIGDKYQIRLTRPNLRALKWRSHNCDRWPYSLDKEMLCILFVIEKVCSYYGRHVICLWLSLFLLLFFPSQLRDG